MAGTHVEFVIVDPHARLAGLEVYDLKQAVMLMGPNLPIVQDAAFSNGFAVHHIRRQPMLTFAIQLEYRHCRILLQDGRQGPMGHGRNHNLRKMQILTAKIHSHRYPGGAMITSAAMASHTKETT
ncbi:hypothetical protein [Noviherbaspirillum sp. L7-7A]|uniref:hypothetical protein n=1 Tax=Noviherbaspirillum sp. L7-7A TaxID=2850560 RepID=UPI0020131410|nr:hypothetical protein [Noviherbaspirillum sp. L7-7A]